MPRDMIDLPVIGRAAQVRAESVDEAARTVEVVWTTGATVRRWSWTDGEIDEELVVDDGAVRLDRLNTGAPFLNSHCNYELESVLGVVVDGTARIEGGVGYATIRFSTREEVSPIWQDIVDGIIRNVSVGYRVHAYEIERRDGMRTLYRAVDWEPMEISAVAIGADPDAHIRSEAVSDAARFNPCTLRGAVPAAHAVNPEEMERNMPQTNPTPAGGTPAAVTTAPDQAALAEAQRAERQRSADILGLCRRHNVPDLATRLISEGTTVEAARGAILDQLAANDAAGGARTEPTLRGRQDETETRRAAMEESLFATLSGNQPTEQVRQFDLVGRSLVDLAAERLGERRVPGGFGQREEILRRAFHSTSDFPLLFENALNRTLAARYAAAQPTYRRIARRRTYADFRDHSTVRAGDFPTLQPVGVEAGEIKGGTFGEAREKTRVLPYGVRVDFSRQMLVNDSLNGLAQVLADRGRAVAKFEDNTFYAMMLSASGAGPTLTETTRAVFNTTDATLAAVAAAITVPSLSLGRAALRKRTGINGALLELNAAILLVGPDKETEAQQIVAPIQAQQAGNVNPFSGTMEVVPTARITGNAWYLFASPDDLPCFEWGLLEGYDAPRFRVEDIFGTQGTAMTLEHDFGCGAIDYRGGYRNAGA